MQKFVARFANDESGATAIEYGLIAFFVGVTIIAGAEILGNALDALFQSIAGEIAVSP